ncbi:MAG: hypothetical protein NVSMB47_03370 [Polyangiales bacterium]
MSDADDAVKQAAQALANRRAPAEEQALLRALAARMTQDESSFDAAHRLARIVPANDEFGEVRVTADGGWKIGSAPERDLLAIWGEGDHPPLARILDGVQESFSSAKVSALVGEIKDTLDREA